MSPRITRLGRLAALLAVAITGVLLSACSAEPAKSAGESPAIVTKNDDGTARVSLTAKAAQRLGIATTKVSGATIAGKSHKAVPYAALLYDAKGQAWVYTNPEPLVFVRAPVTVDRIVADVVIISEGPEVDSLVVVVGVAELYGAEVGVGK